MPVFEVTFTLFVEAEDAAHACSKTAGVRMMADMVVYEDNAIMDGPVLVDSETLEPVE